MGVLADHCPVVRQVITLLPTSLCVLAQENSTPLPTFGVFDEERYLKLPLAGATGFGHRISAVKRDSQS